MQQRTCEKKGDCKEVSTTQSRHEDENGPLGQKGDSGLSSSTYVPGVERTKQSKRDREEGEVSRQGSPGSMTSLGVRFVFLDTCVGVLVYVLLRMNERMNE